MSYFWVGLMICHIAVFQCLRTVTVVEMIPLLRIGAVTWWTPHSSCRCNYTQWDFFPFTVYYLVCLKKMAELTVFLSYADDSCLTALLRAVTDSPLSCCNGPEIKPYFTFLCHSTTCTVLQYRMATITTSRILTQFIFTSHSYWLSPVALQKADDFLIF